MGFQTKSTFDMLCPDGEFDCTKGSTWKIVWPDKPNPPKPEEAAPLPARTLPTATPVKINVTSAGKKVPTDYPPAPPAPIPAAPKPLPPAPPAPKATRAPEKPPKSQQTLEKESEKRTEEKESGKDGKTELWSKIGAEWSICCFNRCTCSKTCYFFVLFTLANLFYCFPRVCFRNEKVNLYQKVNFLGKHCDRYLFYEVREQIW